MWRSSVIERGRSRSSATTTHWSSSAISHPDRRIRTRSASTIMCNGRCQAAPSPRAPSEPWHPSGRRGCCSVVAGPPRRTSRRTRSSSPTTIAGVVSMRCEPTDCGCWGCRPTPGPISWFWSGIRSTPTTRHPAQKSGFGPCARRTGTTYRPSSWPTSRSSPGCIARLGRPRSSAGCSRSSRRRWSSTTTT